MSELKINERILVTRGLVEILLKDPTGVLPPSLWSLLYFHLEEGELSSRDVGETVHWFFSEAIFGHGTILEVGHYPTGISLIVSRSPGSIERKVTHEQ